MTKVKEKRSHKKRVAEKLKKQQAEQKAAQNGDNQLHESAIPVDGNQALHEPQTSNGVGMDLEEDEPGIEDLRADNPLYEQFKWVFEKNGPEEGTGAGNVKGDVFYDDANDYIPDESEEEDDKNVKKESKSKKKKNRGGLSVAELKAIVAKPELVEWTDPDSSDPKLLVSFKSSRNVVPVPSHWSAKREYLSSKRGIEKPPFALPKFIADTGIADMREAVLEKQANQTLKQKQRERVQPKMGKMSIEYATLYNAFFKFQTKPELTRYGDVYYEGKEWETNLKHLRPGELSDDLKQVLSIPPGAPPPWLINQQRQGPPPSYQSLKIPGLNAPPPPGGDWGFHPGGWGKPPVDDQGRPLYGGDVHGLAITTQQKVYVTPVDKTVWGELQHVEEEEPESEEEEEEEALDEPEAEEDAEEPEDTHETTATLDPTPRTIEDITSYGAGAEFTLRKKKQNAPTQQSSEPKSLYTLVPERGASISGLYGSDHTYDINGARPPVLGQEERGTKRKADDVDVSVDVDAMEKDGRLSKDQLSKQYDSERRQEHAQWATGGDDIDEMIMEESRKRLKKDEERRKKR